MQWLLSLAEEYRGHLRNGLFYKALELAKEPKDIGGWIRQLYYQSRDFTSALSLRYAMCKDPRFQQGCFIPQGGGVCQYHLRSIVEHK
jgi:hypothetical protein